MRVFFLLFWGGFLTVSVYAADAQEWLGRLAQADSQNFQGVFVYERNGSFSTHSIWHRVEPNGEVMERLLQMDGPVQEIVRVGGKTRCSNGSLADQLGGQFWPPHPLDPAKLVSLYDVRVVGDSRVAGRPTVKLAIIPRDQHRYGFELYLDHETSLPLKSLLLNEKGQLLERFQFTQLEVGVQPAIKLLQPSAGCLPVHVAEAGKQVRAGWHSEWLPPGFTLDAVLKRRSFASGELVTDLMYGDGLARFSVFLEPLHGVIVEDARSQLGPTAVVSKRLATDDGDIMVTVIGEVPLGTAERIALSMRMGE